MMRLWSTSYYKAIDQYDSETEYRDIATCYESIGSILRTKGEYDGALTAIQKAIDLQRAHGPETPQTARAAANLAVIHQLKGDQEAALEANDKALQISQTVFGSNHSETALLHGNRGVMLQSTGEYDAALEEHHKALAIYMEGDDKLSVGTAYNNIGKVLWRQGEHNKALEMLGYAQEMYMVAGVANDHPLMANTLNNIGLILASRGDPDMALSIHQKALAIREARLGMDHPQTAETLADMDGQSTPKAIIKLPCHISRELYGSNKKCWALTTQRRRRRKSG